MSTYECTNGDADIFLDFFQIVVLRILTKLEKAQTTRV